MKILLALLTTSISLFAQTSFINLNQPAKTSAAVTVGHLLTLNDGCNGCAPGILTVKEISADANLGPVTYGIAMATVGSGLAVNVCTYGNCTCQFSHSSVALQRGGRVIGNRLTSTCQASTDHTNSSIAGISILQDYIGVVAQDGCSDTGLCDVAMAGPWRGGASIYPTIDTIALGPGRIQANFSYATWSTLGGKLFTHVPYTGHLLGQSIQPVNAQTTLSLINSPGLLPAGTYCGIVTFFTRNSLRTTPINQVSMEAYGETVYNNVSNQVTVVNSAIAGQLLFPLPTPIDGRVLLDGGWRIYLSDTNKCDGTNFFNVGQVDYSPLVSSYTINITGADLILNERNPGVDTTGGWIWSQGWTMMGGGVQNESFIDGTFVCGPMSGNGKISGHGNFFCGTGVGRLFKYGQRNVMLGVHGTGADVVYADDYITVGSGNTNYNPVTGKGYNRCFTSGSNLPCTKDGDFKLGGLIDPIDNGKILFTIGGVVKL